MKNRDDPRDALSDRPLAPVVHRARLLLRQYVVLHEMAFEGLDPERRALSPGLLRWLAGASPDAPRAEVAAGLDAEIFGTSVLEQPVPEAWKETFGRLVALGRRLRFGPDEENLVCLLLAVEVSPEVLWTARCLSGRSDLRGFDALFVRHVLDPRMERPWAVANVLDPDAPLSRYGLVRGLDDDEAAGTGPVRMAPSLVRFLLGHPWPDPGPGICVGQAAAQPVAGGEVAFREAVVAEFERVVLEEGDVGVLATPRGGGASLLARIVASRHRLPLVEVDLETLTGPVDQAAVGAEEALKTAVGGAVATGSLLLVQNADAVLRPGTPPSLPHVLGRLLRDLPIPAAVGIAPYAEARLLRWLPPERHRRLSLTIPEPFERERIWEAMLSRRFDGPEATRLAASLKGYPLGSEQIVEVCGSVTATGEAVLDALRAAAAEATGHRLGTLAVRITTLATWDEVVLPPRTLQAVRELIAHARHIKRVLDGWGFGRHLHETRALSALFSGPPGTGKTLVAGLIARELGIECYRVDLARVVSKYIGETEERLARLFDEARVGGVCLLFDEADALFARRTEVRSSVDRYANLEVDFLLQKMEEFDGVTLLTTNFPQSIDEAFLRRIKFRVQFPKPDVEERKRLWQTMIPPEAPVARDIRFDALAEAYDFTGAEIRNAVLRAAFLAAEASGPISLEVLDRAARIECEQAGRVVTRVAYGRPGG